LEALDELASEFMVKGADQTHRKPRKKEEKQKEGDKELDYGADVVDETAPGEPVPAMSTGDLLKLANTIFTLINSNLLKYKGDGTGGGGTPTLTLKDLDWTPRVIGKEGKVVGQINEGVSMGKMPVNMLDYQKELLNVDSIVGYDVDGTPLKVELRGIDVVVPRLVEPGEYTFQYRLTNYDNPSETATADITIKVDY